MRDKRCPRTAPSRENTFSPPFGAAILSPMNEAHRRATRSKSTTSLQLRLFDLRPCVPTTTAASGPRK